MPVTYRQDWGDLEIAPGSGGGPVAFCADLSPASLLGAYRRGIFPLPAADEYARDINEFRYEDQVAAGRVSLVGNAGQDPYWVAWWSPDPRPVIAVGHVHLGRNVRKQLRRGDLRTTADTSFATVAERCRAGRQTRWLTDTLLQSMVALHADGWAHSIEVWQGDDLVGGAFGVGIGHVISGDSMFSRRPDAARIAVADMAERLGRAGGELIDAQWDSPFLRSLGAEPVPRERYLSVLARSAERRALPGEPLPARRLMSAARSAEAENTREAR
jgi:leucyl/phenylalanyl-tRNA--protein transferase